MRLSNTPNFLLLVIFIIFHFGAFAQEPPGKDSTNTSVSIKHTTKGFVFTTSDNKFELQIASRLQFRFATPNDKTPFSADDFTNQNSSVFKINRSRLKIGGHAYQPWLKYYFEYELGQGNLLDFRVMVEKFPWLKFKAGQWKTEFTRERFTSSGEQQLVDRSLINRAFTLDRQQGITLYGNLDAGGIANFDYWVAVLTGTGRGSSVNDDSKLMYFGRAQWNFLGRPLAFEGGDLDISEKPAGIIAFALVTNTSQYTRFSQAGGGSLEGFENGTPGQYRVNQFQIETAFNLKGFSWASEFHRKNILDYSNFQQTDIGGYFMQTDLGGYYMQMGYFPSQIFGFWPEKLEIASRFAAFRPDLNLPDNRQTELSLAFNWFFSGHKNKLTTELSRFTFDGISLPQSEKTRIRVQYDISF